MHFCDLQSQWNCHTINATEIHKTEFTIHSYPTGNYSNSLKFPLTYSGPKKSLLEAFFDTLLLVNPDTYSFPKNQVHYYRTTKSNCHLKGKKDDYLWELAEEHFTFTIFSDVKISQAQTHVNKKMLTFVLKELSLAQSSYRIWECLSMSQNFKC